MPTAWGTRRKRRSKRKKRTPAINDTAAAGDRGGTAVRHGDDDEEQKEAKKRNPGTTEQLQDGDKEDVVSSAPSSPVCEPYIPDDEEYSMELYQAFELEPLPIKFKEKIGGKPLLRCSGFWIDWDEESKTGTIFTTAHLIRSNNSEFDVWLGQDEYDPNAKYDDGGLVIDLDGKVVGMVNITSQGSFIPCSILLMCLDLWRKYGHITRPHLGFKFFATKFLDPLYIEKIWRKYNIDDGLIVNEVADGSNSEMLGIRRGDIISCFNGEQISTTVELENLLLDICKDFDRTNQPSAEVDIVIKVFNIRKSRWRELHLTTNIAEHGEVVARESYATSMHDILILQ
ncbi:hypothetical protein ACQ4PT_021428 [Festuca glaucescens]